MNGETPTKPDGGSWQFTTGDNAPKPPEEQHIENPEDPGQWLDHATQQEAADTAAADVPEMAPAPEATWSASEFIAHEKGIRWFAGLGGSTLLLVLLAYSVIHDTVAVIAIIVIAIIFGMLATHKPRVLEYHVGPAGITIGRKTYPYSEFKSFGVVQEDAFSNITLIPTGRFAPLVSIYYPPEEEKRIVEALSNYMPFAPVTFDGLDRFLRRIRM